MGLKIVRCQKNENSGKKTASTNIVGPEGKKRREGGQHLKKKKITSALGGFAEYIEPGRCELDQRKRVTFPTKKKKKS